MQCLMFQLCKGVAFCHGHGILHRFQFHLKQFILKLGFFFWVINWNQLCFYDTQGSETPQSVDGPKDDDA